MKLFFYFFILVLGQQYYVTSINESEWKYLRMKINNDTRTHKEITSTCYYFKILC